MKRSSLSLFVSILLLSLLLTGCSQQGATSISDVEASLLSQFKKQWAEKKDPGDSRFIQAVQVGQFQRNNGTPYMELIVFWNTTRLYTTSPVVSLGENAFGVSFEVPDTHQNLAAMVTVGE